MKVSSFTHRAIVNDQSKVSSVDAQALVLLSFRDKEISRVLGESESRKVE
jgi:hypothetical protein